MKTLAPERLLALRHSATIESIGSSTRIEGVKLSNAEVERLRLERDEARHTLGRIAAVLFLSRAPLDDEELVEAVLMARDALAQKIQVLIHERRQLRARLVECRPWVGVCPFPNQPGFSEMLAVRDLADDTLNEVKP